ncbi:HNH endonuclease, partial [Ornithinimicrobium sp. F0845]|uniref:HNH endonuclease signature motif containing protein n=1 Tax=Ornithinimicrobium sp. F0845 TaxID=2926412 RepID=UPI001FF68003
EARILALTPGSTLYRLVTDPATGALIERSTTAYKFDKAMRAHIIAADVFCRMPGCLRPASRAQIDHVQEYGTAGGHTCIGNGQPLDEPHHDLKTKKHWDAVIHANRDVT